MQHFRPKKVVEEEVVQEESEQQKKQEEPGFFAKYVCLLHHISIFFIKINQIHFQWFQLLIGLLLINIIPKLLGMDEEGAQRGGANANRRRQQSS